MLHTNPDPYMPYDIVVEKHNEDDGYIYTTHNLSHIFFSSKFALHSYIC